MRTRIPYIAGRLKQAMNSPVGPGTSMVVSWSEFSGTPTIDPVTQSTIGTGTRVTTRLSGFVHFVQIGSTAVKVFNEIEVGDVIVDLPGDVDLNGKIDLRFEIMGEAYVPKLVSDDLAKNWDAVAGGVRLTRTLLLRKAT